MARRTRGTNDGNLINFLSFCAIIIIGLGLLFMALLNIFEIQSELLSTIVSWVERVIQVLAIVFVMYNSYFYARSRSKAWFIIWVIALIVVIVSLVFTWNLF